MKHLLSACCAVCFLPSTSAAALPIAGHTIFQSPQLWSTVDVCNTKDHPLTIGVRGSMPGSGIAQERMFMRFQVQYRNAQGLWAYLGSTADSGFIAVGAGNYKARQAGRNFVLSPKMGSAYLLRGVVAFEWRRAGRVVRRARKGTTAGHHSAAGADPRGYSRATCQLG
ncbi:MAG: hypothetical protein NVS1B9_05860 [Solirubrobacteraceae bacterium]